MNLLQKKMKALFKLSMWQKRLNRAMRFGKMKAV